MRPAGVYGELLTELKYKKRTCNRGNQGQAMKEQCRTTQACRDGIKKARAWLELILVTRCIATGRADTGTLVLKGRPRKCASTAE